MGFNQLTVSPEILQLLLTQFQGKLVDKSSITSYHEVGFGVFTNPVYISDPRIQFTAQIPITDVLANYEANYKTSNKITFATFVKWLVIKSMQNTPFIWRQINGNWYEFANLPMAVTMRTKKQRQLKLFNIEDVSQSSWETFCLKQEEYKAGKLQDVMTVDVGLPIHWIAYQMINVHLPRMTSYNITTRTFYAHQPWIVFSDRYEQEGNKYLPFYLNYSHATLTPEDAELLINQFIAYGKMTPQEVEMATKKHVSF